MARVLIADDDEDLGATLKIVLEREGYEVEVVRDGEQCIKAQQRLPAHLVICDLFMPLRDGLETVEYLRQHYPSVRIIAISGGGYTGQKTDYLGVAQLAGADAALRKPFEMKQLLEKVRRLTSAS